MANPIIFSLSSEHSTWTKNAERLQKYRTLNVHRASGKQWASAGSNWVLACDARTNASVSCTCPVIHRSSCVVCGHWAFVFEVWYCFVAFLSMHVDGQFACSLLIAEYFTTALCCENDWCYCSADCWLCWRLAVYCACLSDRKTVLLSYLLWTTRPVSHHFVQQYAHRSIYSQQYGIKIYRNIAMLRHEM